MELGRSCVKKFTARAGLWICYGKELQSMSLPIILR